jgi:hypothetical protein
MPEQLPLDFSANDPADSVETLRGAVVYSFERARQASRASALAAVYDAIDASVKHVRVRRMTLTEDQSDSRFY